jgi:hypothetical protein
MQKDKKAATAKPSRKRAQHLRVPVSPEEKAAIQRQAAKAGLKVAAYLRNVGMGFEIHGVVDAIQVEELARINGHLGRLGGLLKLWLTNDARVAQFGEATIRAILSRIEDTQDKMIDTMAAVVRPRAAR